MYVNGMAVWMLMSPTISRLRGGYDTKTLLYMSSTAQHSFLRLYWVLRIIGCPDQAGPANYLQDLQPLQTQLLLPVVTLRLPDRNKDEILARVYGFKQGGCIKSWILAPIQA